MVSGCDVHRRWEGTIGVIRIKPSHSFDNPFSPNNREILLTSISAQTYVVPYLAYNLRHGGSPSFNIDGSGRRGEKEERA